MPQKLNVSESLAFLIACIDASGRLDFKRLGDSLEIQPAAARMRLTRLRRAVANREFEDAILVQPGRLDPEIAAIANPDSRKLNAAASKARKTRNAKRAGLAELSPEMVINGDSESEDKLEDGSEDTGEDQAREHSAALPKITSKRKAMSEPPDDSDGDEELFYKDTSSASRNAKQVKMEEDQTDAKVEAGREPTSDTPVQDVRPSRMNDYITERGQQSSTSSPAQQNRPVVQIRRPHSASRVIVPQAHNRSTVQSVLIPQHRPRNDYDSRSNSVRVHLEGTTREKFLAQRAPRHVTQPITPGTRQLANNQEIDGEHGRLSVGPPMVQPTFGHDGNTQSDVPNSSALSTPASVFTSFRPAKPSPQAALNPATKRIFVSKEHQALMPAQKTAPYATLPATPQHLLDPALRNFNPRMHSETNTNRYPSKRVAVRTRESASPAGKRLKVKEEDATTEEIGGIT